MGENLLDSFSELGAAIVENQMRHCFRHGVRFVGQIVTQYYVFQAEIDGWPQRHVGKNHSVRFPSVFVQDYHVCEFLFLHDFG
jgi:hypothetical protein